MKGLRPVIILVVVALLGALALRQGLPLLADRLPGRVRQYLPEQWLAQITTPLPTALPAPPAAADVERALPLLPPAPAVTPVPATATPDRAAALSTPGAPVVTASPAATATATTPPPYPPYARVDGLRIVPQKFNNCGPTNLTIVLNYYGQDVDQFDVAAVVRPNYEDRNVSPEELAAYVESETALAAAVYAGGDLETLKKLLAAGFPVIVEKGLIPDEETGWMGHYLTLVGYEEPTRRFLALDTFLGPWKGYGHVEYETLARYWSHFNHTFLVVYPPERAGAAAEALGETFGDERRMWSRAAEGARQLLTLAPGDAFAWFNLGTSLTQLAQLDGDEALYGQAAAAFDRARLAGLPPRMLWYQFMPYVAYLAAARPEDVLALAEATLVSQGGRNVEETYWYQAQALEQLGRSDEAAAARRQAARLNPTSAWVLQEPGGSD